MTALAFERHGETGPRVLLVVGIGVPGKRWRAIAQDLARDHQVLFFDHRGVGGSPLPPGWPQMANFVQDVVTLLDHVGWKTVHVVGMSFGGMVAQHMVRQHPDRVLTLTLLATHAGGPRRLLPDPRGIWHFFGVRLSRHPQPLFQRVAQLLFQAHVADAQNKTRLGYQPHERDWDPPTPWRTLAAHLHAYAQHDARAWLRTVPPVPTLVVRPGHDVLVAPEAVDDLVARLPHAQVFALPDATHALLREKPLEIAAAIRALVLSSR